MINILLYVLIFLISLICVSAILTQITTLKIKRSIPKFGKITVLHDAEIHWYEVGTGKPIIMLHGLAGNLRNFTYALTDKLNQDYRVIAIDRAGCGWSKRSKPESATLQEQARIISEFIEQEKIEKPLIVGHSLGGAPPRECPTIKGFSIFSCSINSDIILACSCKVALSGFDLFDQPHPAGCGWSKRSKPESATLQEQARIISEFIEQEKIEKPLIVGHSLGGAPPRECPTIKGFSIFSCSINSDIILACSCKVALSGFDLFDQPHPALSIAITR